MEKVKRFMEICASTPDLEEAGKLHVSKRDKNAPRKLNPDSIRFAFKKAHGNIGMPAPVQIFDPENGEDPVVYDFGSF